MNSNFLPKNYKLITNFYFSGAPHSDQAWETTIKNELSLFSDGKCHMDFHMVFFDTGHGETWDYKFDGNFSILEEDEEKKTVSLQFLKTEKHQYYDEKQNEDTVTVEEKEVTMKAKINLETGMHGLEDLAWFPNKTHSFAYKNMEKWEFQVPQTF